MAGYVYKGKTFDAHEPIEDTEPKVKQPKYGIEGLVRSKGKWRATTRHNGKVIHLGMFEDKDEATQTIIQARADIEAGREPTRKLQAPATPRPTTRAERRLRSLKPCGTPAAYERHRSRGEKPCEACTKARTDYIAQLRGTPDHMRHKTIAECGTYSGTIRHYRNKEKPCEPCAEAAREYRRQIRSEQKDAA